MRRLTAGLAGLVFLASTAVMGGADAAEQLPVTYNFLAGAVAAGYPFDSDPPGANDWSCKPTAAHPRPVVLVHGTGGNKNTNWRTYAPLLKNNGYCVYAFTYGVAPGTPPIANQLGGMTPIETSAATMKSFVDKVLASTGASQVDVIGHSQGTVVPEYYAKFLGGQPYIHNYISLASLWHGSNTLDLTMLAKVFGVPENAIPVCGACGEMAPASAFMQNLRAGGLVLGGISYTNIVTRYDELVVPYTSGIEPGMRNLVVQDSCGIDFSDHLEIASDPVASVLVLNTLDPDHPRPVPCMLVLPFTGPLG